MTRFEITALMTAMDRLMDLEDYDGVKKVLKTVLTETLIKGKADDDAN